MSGWMTESTISRRFVLGRSLRNLCIALNAVAEASAMAATRPASCHRSQELQALTESTATTQAAITAITALRRAATVIRLSIRSPHRDIRIITGNRKLLSNWIRIALDTARWQRPAMPAGRQHDNRCYEALYLTPSSATEMPANSIGTAAA